MTLDICACSAELSWEKSMSTRRLGGWKWVCGHVTGRDLEEKLSPSRLSGTGSPSKVSQFCPIPHPPSFLYLFSARPQYDYAIQGCPLSSREQKGQVDEASHSSPDPSGRLTVVCIPPVARSSLLTVEMMPGLSLLPIP